MSTTKRVDSCIGFGLLNVIDKKILIECISSFLNYTPFVDVVIIEDLIKSNTLEYSQAKLFVSGLYYFPLGVPMFCDLCSVHIKSILTNHAEFYAYLATNLQTEIFVFDVIDAYLYDIDGQMRKVDYTEVEIDNELCTIIQENN